MSSQEKTIVIVGATGAQGSSVVNTFLSTTGWHVRALTRSPSGAKAQALQSRGAEVVAADSNDPSTLRAAFEGAHAIFTVTDFWTLYGQAASDPSILKAGQPAIEYAFEKELQQGKNFFDVAATIPTLERFVFSALAQPSKWSNGKYTYSLHFEAKGMAVEYGRTTYPELWAKTSVIQVGFYLENMLRAQWVKPRKISDGEFMFGDLSGDNDPFPFVSADTDTGPITKALVEALPAGKNVTAYRQLMTIPDYAALWGKTLGVKVQVVKASLTEEIMPDAGLRRDMLETFGFAKEFGFFGGDPSGETPQELDVGLDLGTIGDWIKTQDWSSILLAE